MFIVRLISIVCTLVLPLSCRDQEQQLMQVPGAFEEQHIEMPITNLELLDEGFFVQKSFEQLCSNPRVLVSPDGKKVAFVKTTYKTTPPWHAPDARSVRDTHGGGHSEGFYYGKTDQASLKIYIVDSSERSSYIKDFSEYPYDKSFSIENFDEYPFGTIYELFFSTDGTKLAFTYSSDESEQVYVADLTLKKLVSISSGSCAGISSDGIKVLFYKDNDIFVANLENKTVMNISTNYDEMHATISEDGKSVTYDVLHNGKIRRCIVNLYEKTLTW